MMYNVQDIADKIILRTDTECGDIISNLKLQKLLYYLQGFHIAMYGTRLFEQDLEAWAYGPVVPEVFDRFKETRPYGIFLDPKKHSEIELTREQEDLFYDVVDDYGRFSAVELMRMTQGGLPWKAARGQDDIRISDKLMRKHFITLLDEEEA